jgi:signal transduction histidine kinase
LLSRFWLKCVLFAGLMLGASTATLLDLYNAAQIRWTQQQIRIGQVQAWAQAEMDYLRLLAVVAKNASDPAAKRDEVNHQSSAFLISLDMAESALRQQSGTAPPAAEAILPALRALETAVASSLVAQQLDGTSLDAKMLEQQLIPLGPLLHEMVEANRIGYTEAALSIGLAGREVALIALAAASGLVLLLLLLRQVRLGDARQRTIETERAEAAAARARFEDAIESLSEGFAIYDAEDRLVVCNTPQRTAHGRPDAFRPGRKYEEIMRDVLATGLDPERLPEAEATMRRLIEFHRAKDGFLERRTENGTWIRLSKRRTREGGVVTIRADITELKVQQQALAQKTGLLQAVLDNIGSGVSAWDDELKLIAWNAPYVDINGYEPGFLRVGLPLENVLRHHLQVGAFASDHEREIEERIASHRRGEARRELQHRANGQIVDVIIEPLPTGGFTTVLTDVTKERRAEQERRQLEAHLQHTQRVEALGTLAGGVAHDLNNSLVPILALANLLRRKFDDGPERRNLELILQGASRARDLVKQILAFSRKDALKHELFDLAATIREALRMLRASIPSSIRLESELEPVPPLLGDSGQLYQVVVNLITNAAQAIGEQPGTIHVGLREEGVDGAERLHLSVHDNGCGIPPEVLERIFEPFFTTKEVGKGTGLGLSVVHGIITAHHGKITVASRPGEGSTFHIHLPVSAADEEGESPEAPRVLAALGTD